MLTDLEKEILKTTIWDNPYIPKDHMPFPKQIDALLDFRKELLYGGSSGGGKLLYTKTPIYTTMGLNTIDKLRVGDTVFDENGKQCYVLATSNVEYGLDCYKLTFSDGSEIISADTHLWPAVSADEETKIIKRTPEFRAKRRSIRPKRGTGKRPDLAKRNSTQTYKYLPPLKIRNKTTEELYETQQKWGRANYYIPVCKPLRYPTKKLDLDPYVLGVWLGDGTKESSRITGTDKKIFDEIEKRGFEVKQHNYKSWTVYGLIRKIKEIGCYRDKHIPEEYFTASVKQRVDLLRGILDTDGTVVKKSGGVEIQLTRKELIDGISRLLHSLGIKHTVIEGEAKLYGRVTSKKWRIKFFTNIKVFNLKRKSDLQKRKGFRPTVFRRYITKIEKVDSVPTQCIKVSSLSGQYLVGESLIPTHNSDYLLMAALQFVEQPNYNAIIFRRTYSDLSLPEGLIPRSQEWLLNTPAKYKTDLHQWVFPSNSTLTFGYLESESHIYRYKSSSYFFIGFEELTEFPAKHFYTYLFSRLRKPANSKIPLRMRSTTNPDGPGADWVYDRFRPDDPQPQPNGRRFLSAKLYDNPYIDQASYIANLEETDPVTRMQLQEGIWKVKKSGNKFKQEWFDRSYINAEDVPEDGITIRYWDLAATELKPNTRTNNDPDYTVGAKVRLYHNIYYIMDIRRDRLSPGKLEEYIQETAEFDGPETIIYLEQEPGSSGKIMVDDYIRRVLSGYAVFSDRPTGPKEARANVFSAALYNGMVRIVRAPWNKPFVTECCLFPTKGTHDDQCLAKGTKIATIFGDKSIEDIKIGDILITPGGTSTVTWAGQTGEHFTITNEGLTGTPDHKIFNWEKGFIPLITHDVSSRIDTICVSNQIRWIARKLWYSMKLNTNSWGRKDITLASQLPMRGENMLKDCMLPFTSFIREKKYQKAMSYITKMAIHSITQLAILSAWKGRNMLNCASQKILKNKQNILQKLGLKQQNGINPMKDGPGTESTPNIRSIMKKDLIKRVYGVAKNLNHRLVLLNIAQKNAQEKYIEKNENFSKQPVYNLTTEPSHTFYANGRLVSNCDAVSSAIGRLPRAKRWKTGNIGEISTFNPMAHDMTFDLGDLKIEDDGIEEFF